MGRLAIAGLVLVFLSACGSSGDANFVSPSACGSSALAADYRLDGRGFFVVQEDDGNLAYTRRGDLCVMEGPAPYLINGAGVALQVYPPRPDGTFNTGVLVSTEVAHPSGHPVASFSIEADGRLLVAATGQEPEVLGQVAVATVPAAWHMAEASGRLCRTTTSSGERFLATAGSGLAGAVVPLAETDIACDRGRLDVLVNGAGLLRMRSGASVRYDNAVVLGGSPAGLLVNELDYPVSGYLLDADGLPEGPLGDITDPAYVVDPPSATTTVTLGGNLDAGSTPPAAPFDPAVPASYNLRVDSVVYASAGAPFDLHAYFVKTASAGEWQLILRLDDRDWPIGGVTPTTLTFAGATLASPSPLQYDPLDLSASGINEPLAISLDIAAVTQAAGSTAINDITQDGYRPGAVSAIHLATDGRLTVDFDNGRTDIPVARIALASFPAPAQLAPSGDGVTRVETAASGAPTLGTPGDAGLGTLDSTPH